MKTMLDKMEIARKFLWGVLSIVALVVIIFYMVVAGAAGMLVILEILDRAGKLCL